MDKIVQCVTGLLSGLIFPAIVWVVFEVVLKTPVLNRPGVPYFVAIAINLFILRYLVKQGREMASYGLMLTTFIIAILVFKLRQ